MPPQAWDKALSSAQARLPQRAGHRDRADRHHRPGHGLRHHRHRARLRAGEVQEARRRRLLQDHQPRGARSARDARLHRSRDRPRSKPTRSATARWPGAGINHDLAQGQGLHRRAIEKIKGGAGSAFDIKFVFNKWTLGEDFCTDVLGFPTRAERSEPSTCSPTRLLQGRHRGRQHHVCGAMTLEGAPHLKEEHYRCSTAPTRAARRASATCRWTATSA
jgi:hypothetical protein